MRVPVRTVRYVGHPHSYWAALLYREPMPRGKGPDRDMLQILSHNVLHNGLFGKERNQSIEDAIGNVFLIG